MIRKINKKLIAVVALAMALVLAVSAVVSFPSDKITDVIKEQETETRRSYLILGKDKVSGLCDVIMIGSVDPVGDSAILLQVPRDTYAVYSEKGYRKLNGALNTLGAEGFCEFISKNFGVAIDGYLLFDLEVFKRAVDAIGGVDVDLPFDMDYDDPYQGLSIHLDAGRQHLDGAEAEKFVRYRSGYVRGDLGRLDAQKIFMSALFKKLLETDDRGMIVKAVLSVIGDLETDIPLSEIWELVGVAKGLDPQSFLMVTLPGDDTRPTENGAWFYVLSQKSTERVISEYLGCGGVFDPERRFTNDKYESFRKIYGSEADIFAPNAVEIEKNGIDIQKR